MRIAKFGGEIESEVRAVLDDAVTEFHAQSSALLERLLQQQRLQQRVHLLANILQQHRSTELDAVFQRPDQVRVGQLDDVQVVGFLHVLDPLVRLILRVDHQRPTTSVAAQTKPTTIISRQLNELSKHV